MKNCVDCCLLGFVCSDFMSVGGFGVFIEV